MKDWTIMVYLAGDNNLSVEMSYALEQIKSVTNNNNANKINLYVYFDGFSNDVPTLYCDFSADRPVSFYESSKITHKLIKPTKSQENEVNENSASMNNVLNFVDWCVKKDINTTDDGKIVDLRENKNYAMIFSGHSFGFMDWGLFKDEGANYYMTLSKLTWMFERITSSKKDLVEKATKEQKEDREKNRRDWAQEKINERTSEILGKPMALLGFDSCVMSTLEIASQFKGLAETMVASEGSVPNAGWNYAQILLDRVNDDSGSDPINIAASFVDKFIKQQNSFALADISVDMAAWNLKMLPAIETAFAGLAVNLSNCFKVDNPIVYNQMKRLLTQVHWQCQTYLLEQHVDLGDFCQLIISEINLLKNEIANEHIKPFIDVEESCKEVIRSIRDCIILTGFSGRDFQYSNGVSIFFPWSLESYQSAEVDYKKLLINDKNKAGEKWVKFLETYLSQVVFRLAKPLTATDRDGNALISPNAMSVVYESYNVDGKINRVNTGQIGAADEVKQPPNSFKQPPNIFRMFNVMGIFLTRFMTLKNMESNWNRTGFTSTQVAFEPLDATLKPNQPGDGPNPPVQSAVNPHSDKIKITIPRAVPIQHTIDDIIAKIKAVSEGGSSEKHIQEFTNFLSNKSLDDLSVLAVLGNLSRSLDENHGLIPFSLKDAFTKSIEPIRDINVRDNLLANVNTIMQL